MKLALLTLLLSANALACYSDIDCGMDRCIKPQGSFSEGRCGKLVNEFGMEVPRGLPSTQPTQVKDCIYDSDCYPGRCLKRQFESTGMCVR